MKSSPRAHPEAGFTLIELMVVTLLLGVVGGIVVSALATASRSSVSTTSSIQALQELEIAMQRVSRELRAADPLELSSDGDYDTALGAEIDRGGERRVVEFALVENGGRQQLVQIDTGQTLITEVDNGSVPIFRYLDAAGEEIPCSSNCTEVYRDAYQIEIVLLRAQRDAPPVRAETRVAVRSMRYGG